MMSAIWTWAGLVAAYVTWSAMSSATRGTMSLYTFAAFSESPPKRTVEKSVFTMPGLMAVTRIGVPARSWRGGGGEGGSLHVRVRREHLDLVVKPGPGFRRPRLAGPRAEAVRGAAVRVEARALRAVGQGLCAAVRLARRLQPEIRVDDLGVGGGRGGDEAHARAADVAPIGAVGALVGHAVAPGVDDDVRLEAGDALRHRLPQVHGVVVLVLGWVPLSCQAARVVATLVVGMRVVEAPVVLGAHLPERLVAGHVRREAPQVRCHAQVLDGLHEVQHVVLPPEPAAVARVEVHGDVGRVIPDGLHGVGDALLVRGDRGRVPAPRVGPVRRQVRQAVGLDDQDDGHEPVVLAQHGHNLVDVLGLILADPVGAGARRGVVAPAVLEVRATNLPVGGLGVAVAIREVIDDERDELRRGLFGGVGEDALHRLAAFALDLGLGVEPISRRHATHRLERGLHDSIGR
mmetsp:Transcript_30803/g.93205  ORF Transcript_30803/g.93205 Transcript_30803/m.93205 type:complete len:461 (-) Transcript_30803:253-1635(-)